MPKPQVKIDSVCHRPSGRLGDAVRCAAVPNGQSRNRLPCRAMGESGQSKVGLARVTGQTGTEVHDHYLVGLSLKRAQHELRLAVNAELAVLDTNISQVSVLREISLNPGVSSADLARLVWFTPQTLGQLVIQMQARGLLERRPGNGRRISHYLTGPGHALLDAGMQKAREVDANVLRDFADEELGFLVDAFKTIARRAGQSRAHTKISGPAVL
jgi:DNA-binding MarR family transcriptional regulator